MGQKIAVELTRFARRKTLYAAGGLVGMVIIVVELARPIGAARSAQGGIPTA